MVCPNCGTEQPESFECIRCGIVFAKWAERQARVREVPARRMSAPIGITSRILRTLAGIVLVALAVLMYLNGAASKSLGPYVAMVLFAGGGLYFVLSVRDRIRMWRFAAEAGVTVVVSAALFVALPDFFWLRRPMYQMTSMPELSEARAFLQESRRFVGAAQEFLHTKEFENTEKAVMAARALRDDPLDRLFHEVPERDRDMVSSVWQGLQRVRPTLAALVRQFPAELPKGPESWVPAAIKEQLLRDLDRVTAEVDAALNTVMAREKGAVEPTAP